MSNQATGEIERIKRFYYQTIQRIGELESKSFLSKRDQYELDMCIADAQRADRAIKKATTKPDDTGKE